MKRQKFLWGVLMMTVVLVPLFVFAWAPGDPLVPCGTSEHPESCSLCHIYVLAQNIIGFLMWVAAPVLAVLGFTWGGFKILVSGANPGLRADGFRIIKTVLWGLLIVFGAWIVVNELLQFFARGGFQAIPWTEIQCRRP